MQTDSTIGITPQLGSPYLFEGGQNGADRLEVLARLTAGPSEQFLLRAGVRPGTNCIDLGCGSGQ